MEKVQEIQNGSEPFTVLRIKRKRNEESPSTLIVNDKDSQRKRIKKEPNRVFKLVDSFDFQTFKEKESSKKLKEHLTNIDIEKKSHGLESTKRELMQNKIKESKAARYKVITKNRAMKTGEDEKTDEYQLYDVVKEDSLEGLFYGSKKEEELMCNFNKMVKEYLQVSNDNTPSAADNDDSQDNYVYDLYIPVDSDKINENDAANLIWEELDNDIYDYNEDDNSSYDSEDSNAEDYYQNEYPSEEDEGGLYSSSEDDDDDDDDYDFDSEEDDYENFRRSYYPYKKNSNRFYNNFEYTEEDYDNDFGY
ncbi:hypothetical protein BCR32DRAFT_294655 [Anaeromyces robustus]|uniref:Probable RNA polymerase II nuclear localization protein SLC7A6OS n=1 Tax=Anaeromyces robustus TaxID=1754192 RepID=A0A1Y1X020_9FUNG|nr:hypothetical protein BCR32DRAFT_294655 [Anaeromyces robustus]|eukprot:ORX79073.1 hypothetical protein BCR32DRAFT_294655 [Anaeromyces robustus]